MTLLLQDTLVISPATVNKIEQEIEDLRSATDCADIVQSKSDLDSYDTSKLTDNAIVKVLQDESKDDAETYYRYSKSSDSFTFIGELGPYYTKSEDDALLAGKVDKTNTEYRVYGTNSAGAQTTIRYSSQLDTSESIVQRTSANQINVAQTPTQNTHATSKKYVDDELAKKVTANNNITGATHTKITYDSKGLVTAGSDIVASDVTDLTATASEINQLHSSSVVTADLTKLHNVTSDANELNVLDGITATTTELNYVHGVTSDIQTQINSKQATLVNQTNIKSVNGNSLLGSGNLEIAAHLDYPSSWPTTSATTTKQFCDAVAADTTAVEGKMYLGEVRWSDLPGLVNGEVEVEIMSGSTASNKVITLTLTSGNKSPYLWKYTYWNGGSNVSGWKGFVPTTSTASQVYVTDNSGNQSTIEYAADSSGNNTIVRRTSTGRIVTATPTANTHATTKKYVDDADALKQNKPTITTSDTTTLSIALEDNTIYNNTSAGLTTLDITIPANPTIDFSSEINFTSGSVATVVTGNDIVWLGDNVNENTGFIPRANCRYSIIFTYDGTNIRGLVQGISLQ